MWMLMTIYPIVAFATVIETAEDCQQLALANLSWWAETGQQALAVCMATVEV